MSILILIGILIYHLTHSLFTGLSWFAITKTNSTCPKPILGRIFGEKKMELSIVSTVAVIWISKSLKEMFDKSTLFGFTYSPPKSLLKENEKFKKKNQSIRFHIGNPPIHWHCKGCWGWWCYTQMKIRSIQWKSTTVKTVTRVAKTFQCGTNMFWHFVILCK